MSPSEAGVAVPAAGRRPLLVSYGGGHANIMIAVTAELARRGRSYDLLGLTTAEEAFRRAGLNPFSLEELIDPLMDRAVRDRAAALAPASDHPDISDAQTTAYHIVGFADLVAQNGLEEAEEKFARLGRKAFEPVRAFERLFARIRPTVVVATTSPRFELAALKAARRTGIPSLAIGDMYLIAEQEWILGGEYADHLTVIGEGVGSMLQQSGKLSSQIHVLGNPAFDALAPAPDDSAVRAAERERLGIGDRTCILWPLGGAAVPVADRMLLEAAEVACFLERLCEMDPALTYVMRPHPNWPVGNLQLKHGRVDAGSALEKALLAADLVCVEASTVGLQAVLKGIPTICYNYADYVLYPEFGWAAKANTLDELAELVIARAYFEPPAELRAQVGNASRRVTDLIEQLEREAAQA